MTMFKTREQVEEMARDYAQECKDNFHSVGGVSEAYLIADYLKGYTRAQQDIKEACSKGFVGWLNNSSSLTSEQVKKFREMNEQERIGFALSEGFTAGKLSSMKELQEKDEKLKEIREALQIIYDNSRANYIDKQEKEKFRQIVEKYKLHKY